MSTADIQVIWENSNEGCEYNKYHNHLLIFSCFESCFVSTTDFPSSITNTTVDYVDDNDYVPYISIEISSACENAKILKQYKKIDPWLKKISKSSSRSKVPKGKYHNKKMKFNKKIQKKGNFRKK